MNPSGETPPKAGRIKFFGRRLPAALGWTISIFALVNILGDFIRPGFDANYLWMPLSEALWAHLLIGAVAVLLIWSLLRPASGGPRYLLTEWLLIFLAAVAFLSGVQFYRQIFSGAISARIPFPFTWLVVIALAMQMWRIRRGHLGGETPPGNGLRRGLATFAGALIVWVLFLWCQFYLVGGVSSGRRADCILVLGAGVKWDGSPSASLRDRTLTGCELYKAGRGAMLIFSGGITSPYFTEPKSMRRVALAEPGITREDILLDEEGHSTWDTAVNAKRILPENGWRNALVVTHDYHLSRTLLICRRAGLVVYPVPAVRNSFYWPKEIHNLVRETAAWTYYYLRPLWEPIG